MNRSYLTISDYMGIAYSNPWYYTTNKLTDVKPIFAVLIPVADRDIVNKMFGYYLYPRFAVSNINYIDDDETVNWDEFEGLFGSWLIESTERYSKLIKFYDDAANKLMDKIGSTTRTLYNDTPQAGGDFTTDPYVTNATQTETNSDVATPIDRLDEIRVKLHNLYHDWATEFRRFIVKY